MGVLPMLRNEMITFLVRQYEANKVNDTGPVALLFRQNSVHLVPCSCPGKKFCVRP